MQKIQHLRILFLTTFTLLFVAKAMTQGNLLVTPKRVLFDGPNRTEILNISNTGSDTATYQISFVQMRMTTNGSFENISVPDSGQQFADKNIRFFPRSVTLGPNEAQTVKLQLIRADQLATGEYRSHLYLRAVPTERPRGDTTGSSASGISVKIVPIFGISIPVIIRVGQTQAQATIADARVLPPLPSPSADAATVQSGPRLELLFNRSGNQSLYGDVSVSYISPDGKTTPVSSAKGIALYTPNLSRKVSIPLEKKIDYTKGKLHVVYADQSPRPLRIAETFITLN